MLSQAGAWERGEEPGKEKFVARLVTSEIQIINNEKGAN